MSSRHGRGDGDEYGDYSPPPSYYGAKASSGSRSPAHRGSARGGGGTAENEEEDVYNYEVGTGSSSGKKKKKDKDKKPSSKPVTPVRKSTEDRIAEIMARHGVDLATKPASTSSPLGARDSVEMLHSVASTDVSVGGEGDEPSSFKDFARSLMQLRASIGDPAVQTSQEEAPTSKSPTPVAMATSPAVTPPAQRNRRASQASEDSSDISDGDFEAGAYAKRVQQRKREEREAAQERAKTLLAASPPPLREEDSPPPSASPQRPQTTSGGFEMEDYDDSGVGRYGSPPPSYGMYDDDDDERAVGSRTPHYREHEGEEEDGRYLMDQHEFDQSSGNESISPLYGGGLQRDEAMAGDGGRSPLNSDLSASSPMGGRLLGSPAFDARDTAPGMARDEDTPLGSQLSSAFSAPSLRFEEGGGLHLTPVSSQGGRASMAYSDDLDTDDAPPTHTSQPQPSPSMPPSTYSAAPSPQREAAPSPSASPLRTTDLSPPRPSEAAIISVGGSAQGSLSPPPPPIIIGRTMSSSRDTAGPPFAMPPPLTITALPPPAVTQAQTDDPPSEATSRSAPASPYRPSLSPAPPSPSAAPRPLWGSTDSGRAEDGARARVPSWAASPPPPSPPQDQQEQGHSDDTSEGGEEEEEYRQRHSDELELDDRDLPAAGRDEDVPPPPPPPPSTGGPMAIVSQPPVVPLQEVANGLRLLKGHSVTRVSDAQSFPGRHATPATVLLRGEGSPLQSPARAAGHMHMHGEEDEEEEAAGLGRGAVRRRGKAGSDKSLQSKRRAGLGTLRGGAARGGAALSRGRGGSSTSAPPTRSPAKTTAATAGGASKRRASSAPGSRDSTPSRPTRRPASTTHAPAPPTPPSALHPREAEQMEREASLYEWERALEERVLRLELQERLLTKKELAVDRTSRSLQDLQGSLEVELRSAAAVVAGGNGPDAEAREEEVAKLKEELDEARNETATLRGELDSLRARWDFVSGVDGALKAAADASASTTAGLRTLRTQAGTRGGAQGQAGGEEVLVSVADLSALRRDHEAQERLLEGFQKENERLVTQMTELKHSVARERRDMGREREAMHKEVNNLRNQLTGHGLATDSDRLQAGLRAEAQLRYLEEDIARERKANQERELEFRYELDRLRQAKMDAELRAEGLNRQVLEEGDREVLRLEQVLREERAQSEAELRACRDKLKWYAENQELLEGHANKVAKQADEITRLRRDLAAARRGGTQGGAAAKPGSRQEGMERRIKELEKQLLEMEQALQKRNPDCIASLIRATRGGGAEDGGQGQGREGELKSRVKELEEELERRKESAQVMLRSLRQEHEKVKLGYEERIKRLEEGTAAGPAGGAGRKGAAAKEAHPSRVKELEKELEGVRAFYTKKLKDAERKAETQMRALKRGSLSRAPAAPAGPPSVRSGRSSKPTAGTEGDKSPRLELVEVGVATNEAELSPVAPSPSSADVEGQQRRLEKAETEVQALRRALQERDDELARLVAGARDGREEAGPGVRASVPAPPNIEWQKEQVRAVEEAVTRALERMNSGGAPAHPSHDPPPRRPSDPPAYPEVESLRRAQEALKDEVVRKDEQLTALRDGLTGLRAELQHLRTQQQQHQQQQQSQSNMMMSGMGDAHYQALAAQVVSLERRAANRERELSEMIETSASKHQLQVLLLRTEYEQQLAEKDEQIRRFREELDALLQALEGLRDGRRRTLGALATS